MLKQVIINKTGFFGRFGGRFVPEAIVPVMDQLNDAFFSAIEDSLFLDSFKKLSATFTNRPSPLIYAERLSEKYSCQLYIKNEGANHTGAHKINHVLGQILLAKRMGKKRIIAETGAGQHGLATAAVAAKLGMPAKIYMGYKDYCRQRPNVYYMELMGAEVIPVKYGDATLRSAITEAFKELLSHPEETHYLLGTACGPRPYPSMNVYFQKLISEEIKMELKADPDAIIACVGGGSNALGAFYSFLDSPKTELVAVEAGGKSKRLGEHAIRIGEGQETVFEGFRSIFLTETNGNMAETHSISAGMDYGGISPQLAFLSDIQRVNFDMALDEDALSSIRIIAENEGLIPALESAHAFAYFFREAKRFQGKTVVINCSGRGEKDLFITMPYFQNDKYHEFIEEKHVSLMQEISGELTNAN